MTLLHLLIIWLAISLILAIRVKGENQSLLISWLVVFIFHPFLLMAIIFTGMTYITLFPVNLLDYLSQKFQK